MIKNFWTWIENNKLNICIALVFLITLSIRIYAINNKTVVFWDDTASIIASTMNNKLDNGAKFKFNWNKIAFPYRHNFTAYEVKKALFENKSDIKSIIEDVKTLHNETIDHQHPNLYYTILRIWSSGVDFTDYKAMIARGCYLNLIFFTLSFFFMYKLLNLIKPDKKFIALGLFFAFILTGSISNTLLIRPYPMAECFFILTLYQFVDLYNSIDKEKIIPIKKCILYSIGFALFLLSYYFAIIFILFIFFLITIKCIKTKNKVFWEYFYLTIFSSFLITYLFCPLYFYNLTVTEHLGSTQGKIAFWNIINFTKNGTWIIELANKYVFYNISFYIIIFGLACLGVSVLEKKQFEKKNLETFALIYIVTMFYTYIISALCPYKEYAAARYIIFLFPIISLALTMVTYILKRSIIIPLVIITFFASFFPIWKYHLDEVTTGFLGTITYYKDFEFFNINKYIYEEDSDKMLPIVFTNKNNGLWYNYFFYLPDNAIVRFEEERSDIFKNDNYVFKKYLLVNAGERKGINRKENTVILVKNKKGYSIK